MDTTSTAPSAGSILFEVFYVVLVDFRPGADEILHVWLLPPLYCDQDHVLYYLAAYNSIPFLLSSTNQLINVLITKRRAAATSNTIGNWFNQRRRRMVQSQQGICATTCLDSNRTKPSKLRRLEQSHAEQIVGRFSICGFTLLSTSVLWFVICDERRFIRVIQRLKSSSYLFYLIASSPLLSILNHARADWMDDHATIDLLFQRTEENICIILSVSKQPYTIQ